MKKKWKQENRKHLSEYDKKWRQENIEHHRGVVREWHRRKYKEDSDYKIAKTVRNMFGRILQLTKEQKHESTFSVLGYSVDEFKTNIESKMLSGMTWENHGSVWQIDHIYPVSRYIRDGVNDPTIINRLSNLIPMYSEDNLNKWDKTLEEFLDENPDLYYRYGNHVEQKKEYEL